MKKFLSFAMVLVMLLALCGCDKLDYNKAMKAYDNGEYAEARDLFAELGDYEDSAKMVKDCDYRIAKRAMDNEDYEAALKTFEKLDDYKESKELALECKYGLALAMMDEGEYEDAVELLTEIADYEDASEQLQECDYQLALEAIEAGENDAAMEKLTALGDYKDSTDLINGLICGQLVGDWVSVYDYTETIADTFALSVGTEALEYMQFKDLAWEMKLSVAEDYSWNFSFDNDSFMQFVENMKMVLTEGINAYFPAVLEDAAAEAGLTMQDFYDAYEVENMDELIVVLLEGYTVEEFVEEAFSDMYDVDMDDYSSDGTVYAEDGQIVVDSYDYTIESMTYDPETDTLTVTFFYNELGVDTLTFTRK